MNLVRRRWGCRLVLLRRLRLLLLLDWRSLDVHNLMVVLGRGGLASGTRHPSLTGGILVATAFVEMNELLMAN
jgi:hypothetical protein